MNIDFNDINLIKLIASERIRRKMDGYIISDGRSYYRYEDALNEEIGIIYKERENNND